MSTTYTSNAGLGKPARADRNWDVQLNANCDTLDACAAIGALAVTPTEFPSASLNVKVAAGRFRQSNGTLVTFAGRTSQAVTANATTYLWLTEAGVLTTGTSFPSGTNIVMLAAVTAGASTITTIGDQRTPWFSFGTQTTTGTGTVTSVGLALPADWSVTNSPVTTTGVLTATRANQNANVLLAGPASGGPASPSYRALVGADLPVFAASGTAHAPGAVPDPGGTAGTTRFLREDATWAAPPSGGPSGVTSVGLTMPLQFTVSGAPVTSAGTFAVGWNNQTANQVFAGPPSGTAAAPTYRALVGADLPVFGPSGTGHAPGAVPDPGATAGATRFLREDGTWQAPATGTGTVTSVGLSLPSFLTVSGSPVTSSGTLTAALSAQAANTVFAGPSSGTAAAPTYRALVGADLPVFGAAGSAHSVGAVPDPGGGSASATALVQSAYQYVYMSPQSTGTAATFGTATTTGNLLVAVVAGKAASGSTAPTFTITDTSGGTWTLAASKTVNSSGGYSVSIFYLANITGESTHNVTATPSLSSYLSLSIFEISGALKTSPLGQTATNNGSSSSPSATGATCSTGSFVLSGMTSDSGGGVTITDGSGWTGGNSNTSEIGVVLASEYQANIAAGTITPSFTQSSSADWAIVMAEFKAASGSTLQFLGNDAGWHTIAGGLTSVFGRTGVVVATSGDYAVAQITGAAPLASPALTGTPTAPTPSTSTNSTQLATTAYVQAQGYLTSSSIVSGSQVSGNISGSAGGLTGTLAIANGGTGQTSAAAAFNALAPITTLGDLIYGSAASTGSRLAGNATATKKFLTQTGTGAVSAAPGWNTIAAADLPVMGPSGSSHAPGAAPDPGSSSGTVRYLREDATWQVPPSASASYTWAVTTPSSYPYTCLATDAVVLVDSSAVRTITLPSGTSAGIGRIYILKDATGSAATNNITVTVSGGGTIDSATQALITTNLGEAEFISDGTNWRRKYNRPDLIDGNLTVNHKLLVGGNLNLSVCSFTTQTFTLNPNLSVNLVNYTGSGGVTATLPTAASVGTNLLLVVKDMAGTAGTNNIAIQAGGTDKIDGAASITITANYGAVRLLCDGSSNWYSW